MKRSFIITLIMLSISTIGCTSLNEAVIKGDAANVKKNIAKGEDVNLKDKNGDTPLITAVKNGNLEITRMLIDAKADVNVKDNAGNTPLIIICKTKRTDIAELLIKAGADVNEKNNSGETSLLNASKNGNIPMMQLLYKANAGNQLNETEANDELNTSGRAIIDLILSVYEEKGQKIRVSKRYPLIIYFNDEKSGMQRIAHSFNNKGFVFEALIYLKMEFQMFFPGSSIPGDSDVAVMIDDPEWNIVKGHCIYSGIILVESNLIRFISGGMKTLSGSNSAVFSNGSLAEMNGVMYKYANGRWKMR